MAEFKRFYDTFKPDHYNIYLDIDRDKKTITGKTVIKGLAEQEQISIHQKALKVSSVQLIDEPLSFKTDDKNDAINVQLPKAGPVEITIEYTAPLTDTMMGIYPSYYEVDGVKKQIIGTQFETNAARQAFPCVDEPEAKAQFDLAIKFDEQPGETILSNMPELKHENGVHYFDTTVKMSTYLIAFAFGDLQGKTTTTKSGVKVGVFATKAHKANELDFALDIAKRSIEFYEDFYQTPYPLPHSWQLALPDFSAGAMENWGLVTYREAYLVLDPDNTALTTKQLVATVIAHELAHQWFGDLVTMKWWDDLWLNESFANMMEFVAIDAIEPEWRIWENFQTSDVQAALKRDATDGVQSVHVQVNHPAEIDSLFDAAIVYAKGARMLVMARALVGDDALRKGLKNYFADHQYSNATGADLWNALGEASGMDVESIMNSWLEQPGYPVVTAKVENGELKLTQKQFFIGDGEDKGRQWHIPLNSNYQDVPAIFKDNELSLGNYAELKSKNGNQPFRLNVGNDSHFIVKYDDTLLNDILEHDDKLDNMSKMQILQDLKLLAEGKQVSYAKVIPFLRKFAGENSVVVNSIIYDLAYDLEDFVNPGSNEENNLRKFIGQLSAKQADRLGWKPNANDSKDDQVTRRLSLGGMLYAKDSDAVNTAHKIFSQYKTNLISLPADIRTLVLSNEVKNFGSDELFEKLLASYRKTSDASYKNSLGSALTDAKSESVLAKLVSHFEDSETIKPQDLRGWYRYILDNDKGQQLAWDWIRNEWQWLEDTVGGDMEFATFITVTANVFHTSERFTEFKAFFEPKLNTPGLTREIKMDTKALASRVDLIESERDAVNAELSK
ncbi:M1 family metallopeptidase [Apilactobacillus xinyiensis]|uniref:M1 family metallopeptidase n=1 Tax=Apilactobacillus xinyiensis TaxID=2841032 RepID=UPI003364BC08